MTQSPDLVGESAVAAGKASIPIAVSGAAAAGLSLQEWVFIATLVYLGLQIAHLIFKWWRDLAEENSDG